MKQISRNNLEDNYANIFNFVDLNNFCKICDYCEEVFEADLSKMNSFIYGEGRRDEIKCPICFTTYYITYNDLNDFYYLELAKSPYDENFVYL